MTSPPTDAALVEAPYVLLKRGLFERPGHHGYTGVLRHAGRFSHKEASAYAVHGGSVTMMLASEAPDYSPACWHETRVGDLVELLQDARTENATLRAERDEADRRAGAAERKAEHDRDSSRKRDGWLHRAKKQAGYHDNVSFDRVWEETLARAGRAASLDQEVARLRSGGAVDEWSPIATAPRDESHILAAREGMPAARVFFSVGRWWLHGCGPLSRSPVALEGLYAPTLWQRLPVAPSEVATNSTDSTEPPPAA